MIILLEFKRFFQSKIKWLIQNKNGNKNIIMNDKKLGFDLWKYKLDII